jgi:hypothetical protein
MILHHHVSVDGESFADIHELCVYATTSPATEYAFQPAASVETALVCLKIYRRDGPGAGAPSDSDTTTARPGSPTTSTLPDASSSRGAGHGQTTPRSAHRHAPPGRSRAANPSPTY